MSDSFHVDILLSWYLPQKIQKPIFPLCNLVPCNACSHQDTVCLNRHSIVSSKALCVFNSQLEVLRACAATSRSRPRPDILVSLDNSTSSAPPASSSNVTLGGSMWPHWPYDWTVPTHVYPNDYERRGIDRITVHFSDPGTESIYEGQEFIFFRSIYRIHGALAKYSIF